MIKAAALHFDIDTSKLRGRIVEKCRNLQIFADCMGINSATLSKKLAGRTSWDQQEILRAVELLDLEVSDIPAYFFTEKVIEI
jgi:hypothetical protein